jgi:glycosyltransferase involved in cell wall biosynthesis
MDVRPYLANADAYLLTSRYEGLPIGALEAFEAGLPMILANFEGASELAIAHPLAHILTSAKDANNAEETVALINYFHADKARLRAEIQATWQQNWSPEIFAQRHKAFVKSVLTPPD